MARPTRTRRIFFQPDVTYFKPAGIPMVNLKETLLSFDELEAIRLIDSERIEQNEAGKKMKISQSALSRLLRKGRKKFLNSRILRDYDLFYVSLGGCTHSTHSP